MNLVKEIEGLVKIERAIISVFNKDGLEELVPELVKINPQICILSTGGTYHAIANILGSASPENLIKISDYTQQPEMQGGLVKTLDFKIYLGLLSETYNQFHTTDLKRTSAYPLDMVVANLYPFQDVIAGRNITVERARANIDIGGPCMIRASAKNFHRVTVVTAPSDYEGILLELKEQEGFVTLKTRFELAKKAFTRTADYDRAIETYLRDRSYQELLKIYQIHEETLNLNKRH